MTSADSAWTQVGSAGRQAITVLRREGRRCRSSLVCSGQERGGGSVPTTGRISVTHLDRTRAEHEPGSQVGAKYPS